MYFHIAIPLHPVLLFIRIGEKTYLNWWISYNFSILLSLEIEIVIKFVEDFSDSCSVAIKLWTIVS